MQYLLKRLNVLDPATYDEIVRVRLEQFDIEYEGDLIQGIIQRAAIKRGWYCQVVWGAYIGYMATVEGNTEEGDSPAAALLAAYLGALV